MVRIFTGRENATEYLGRYDQRTVRNKLSHACALVVFYILTFLISFLTDLLGKYFPSSLHDRVLGNRQFE